MAVRHTAPTALTAERTAAQARHLYVKPYLTRSAETARCAAVTAPER